MRVTVFDYGAGNLHSLVKALAGRGRRVGLEPDPRRAVETDVLLLPGVGAFAPAARALAPGRDAMRAALGAGLPCLGICLGMHLLFEASAEGEGEGLGVIGGQVERLRARRVPQIGWNAVAAAGAGEPLVERAGVTVAYYANSYVCRPSAEASVVAWSTHEGDRFPAAVRVGRTVGVQFHPEKSSAPGVRFLEEFLRQC